MFRKLIFAALCLSVSMGASAAERWETLPKTPLPITGTKTGYAAVNGVKIYYAISGHGSPVLFLHGGLSNSDYWGNQVKALAAKHTVITLDSRGHGRSSRNAQPFGYDLMADDVVGVLDTLKIPRVAVVGWSDGAIIGLDLAMRYPQRTGKVFAFAPNTLTSGVKDHVEQNPTFAAFIARAGNEYTHLSPTPKDYESFVEQISHMWASQPNWSDEDLKRITSSVLIVDGDHDEAIKRDHLEYIAATIPKAGLLILPNASHFAFLQAPAYFSAAVLHFLEDQ
jgi:pimeloyl-ACP methyl ester carboxylesterase